MYWSTITFWLLFLFTIFNFIPFIFAVPVAKCRLCKNCEEAANSTTKRPDSAGNQTDLFANQIDETAELINAILTQNETISSREKNFLIRSKRQSFVEKRPCPRRFQIELFLIPASILAIPLVLFLFLLCACFCGKKEGRARMPEVWYMKRKRKRHDTADDLYFGEDYVKRINSQKTRFNTKVTIIERRRESAITVSSNGPDSLEPNKRKLAIVPNDSSFKTTNF